MQIRFAAQRPSGDHALIVPIAGAARGALDAFGPAKAGIEAAIKRQRFEGEAGSAAEYYLDSDGGRRLVLVGTGAEPKPDSAERLGGAVTARLLTSGEREVVIDLTGTDYDADNAARVALGAMLRAWRHDRYRTRLKDKLRPTLDLITLVGAPDGAEARWTERYAPLVEGIVLTRELVAEPANIVYPESFVERVRHLTDLGIEIRVLGEAEMAKLGMGALLGVSQGSVREAQLLVLSWNGGEPGATPTVFVGKGVTFDTGGISIKPSEGMEAMKYDMSGGATVLGTMRAIALLKPSIPVLGIVAAVENMPDGAASRPSDVVTAMNGKTVEILNTDAEGRLILADAVAYAEKQGATRIVDMATLTGAVIIALGDINTGIMGNDQKLIDEIVACGKDCGEGFWQLPLGKEYSKQIKSEIADIKNIGPRGKAGTIMGAVFIEEFVDTAKWAHLDIAGTAWCDIVKPHQAKGPTGVAIRTLLKLVENSQ